MTWLTSEESIARYKDALHLATTKDDAFAQFRRLAGLREIVEGVPDVVGRGYHAKLCAQLGHDDLGSEWARITKNDSVGNPTLVELAPHGHAASTTMRYAWNVADMDRHGVVLDDADIVEVGGGYGGLCRMIHEYHKPRSYTIVDLPEACALAMRYLKEFDIRPFFKSASGFSTRELKAQTFISNYALTELTKDVQDGYIKGLMDCAPYGYVTYNSQPRNVGQQHSLDDLKSFVAGNAVVEDENVKKSECKVLIWTP